MSETQDDELEMVDTTSPDEWGAGGHPEAGGPWLSAPGVRHEAAVWFAHADAAAEALEFAGNGGEEATIEIIEEEFDPSLDPSGAPSVTDSSTEGTENRELDQPLEENSDEREPLDD